MKIVVIADLHGLSSWEEIVSSHKDADKVVFLGDYFDSFKILGIDQIYNFKKIIEYKNTSNSEVVMLIGNHDHHYFPEIGYSGTSGFQNKMSVYINQTIQDNRNHLQMAYKTDGFLFTHAGVSQVFMDNTFGINKWDVDNIDQELNDLFKYKPKLFEFFGRESSGDDMCQTPIWIRPRSLMRANKDSEIKNKYIQVVGHTKVMQIDIKALSIGGRYYFIDCLDTSGQYMVINDNVINFDTLIK
jgi:predicted phosphodiesterase